MCHELDRINLVKICYDGFVSGSSQVLILPQLPQNMMLTSEVVKSDSKIITLLHTSKFAISSVATFWLLKMICPEDILLRSILLVSNFSKKVTRVLKTVLFHAFYLKNNLKFAIVVVTLYQLQNCEKIYKPIKRTEGIVVALPPHSYQLVQRKPWNFLLCFIGSVNKKKFFSSFFSSEIINVIELDLWKTWEICKIYAVKVF